MKEEKIVAKKVFPCRSRMFKINPRNNHSSKSTIRIAPNSDLIINQWESAFHEKRRHNIFIPKIKKISILPMAQNRKNISIFQEFNGRFANC
jgi:hypothetical protein